MQSSISLTKPTVFVGSSTEGLPYAKKLRQLLSRTAICNIWNMDGQFGLGEFTLEALIKITKEHDFAIMILTQDDLINRRGRNTFVPRDNVVFELGLFMGALGRDRTFIVHDKRMAMPSDLDGITRSEFLEMADLRNACRKLRDAMICAPPRGRDLDGKWFSAYQRHDAKVGRWVRDIVEIKTISPGKLLFRNSFDSAGSNYKAIGHFENQNEIVGAWYETLDTAYGRGTFHLYKDPYFPKMYGVCTGPTTKGQPVYSGWLLARGHHNQLAEARRDLMESMLVNRYKLPAIPEIKTGRTKSR
jgi:Predicted nucleotide-binding protein containing TIR-like domain